MNGDGGVLLVWGAGTLVVGGVLALIGFAGLFNGGWWLVGISIVGFPLAAAGVGSRWPEWRHFVAPAMLAPSAPFALLLGSAALAETGLAAGSFWVGIWAGCFVLAWGAAHLAARGKSGV